MTFLFKKSHSWNCIFKMHVAFYHRVSMAYPSIDFRSRSYLEDTLGLSQRMQDAGIIAANGSGLFTLLPFGLKSIEKLLDNIDHYMKQINAQKLALPILINQSLWKTSGRLESAGPEVMQVKDRHEQAYILGPTHEEAVTHLISNLSISSNKLPLRLYQVSNKFRDEMRSKHGLLRSREFLMKDLYSFDKDSESAQRTYNEISELYASFFASLNIPVKKVEASVGSVGGLLSHEYHIPCEIGEDVLYDCEDCMISMNSEILTANDYCCPHCKSPMKSSKGIEVGHTFLLGTKYSMPLAASYLNSEGKNVILEMGCYGIGLTRLLAAALAVLSKNENFIWPQRIVPFKVCLIPAKRGSKEEVTSNMWCDHLESIISRIPEYFDNVIVDDRVKFTIGKRVKDIKRLGIPLIIVIGKSCLNDLPHFELIDVYNENSLEITQSDMLEYLKNFDKNM